MAKWGFNLNGGEFRDALFLRYGWNPQGLPSECACGSKFNVEHSQQCPRGGFIIQRHDEVRDVLRDCLNETKCSDIWGETPLMSLSEHQRQFLSGRYATSNVEEGARLDLSARGFWGRRQRAFFDVRVYNPNAPSYSNQSPKDLYRRFEQEKKRKYNGRVLEVEQGSFTPLVFSNSGGSGPECTKFLRRLSEMMADRRRERQSTVMGWLRTRLSFSLLRSSIICLRGCRISKKHALAVREADFELARASSHFEGETV